MTICLLFCFAALNGKEERWEEPPEATIRPNEKPCLPSVSSALVLGTLLGVGEACILTFLAGPILTVMGVSEVSRPVTNHFLLGPTSYSCKMACVSELQNCAKGPIHT